MVSADDIMSSDNMLSDDKILSVDLNMLSDNMYQIRKCYKIT
jgi:hypothetical protein